MRNMLPAMKLIAQGAVAFQQDLQHPAADRGHLQSVLGAGRIDMGHGPGDAVGVVMHGRPSHY